MSSVAMGGRCVTVMVTVAVLRWWVPSLAA